MRRGIPGGTRFVASAFLPFVLEGRALSRPIDDRVPAKQKRPRQRVCLKTRPTVLYRGWKVSRNPSRSVLLRPVLIILSEAREF